MSNGNVYRSRLLNELRDIALRIANEHGFKDASIGEDIALIHSEASEALESHRGGMKPDEYLYEDAFGEYYKFEEAPAGCKPVGIPSEMADILIRVFHFCGKHGIDIDRAVAEKMAHNESRPFKHGGKAI